MGIREKLNFKTNKGIRDHVQTYSDFQIIDLYRSTRRDVTSALTGVGINSAGSLLIPPLFGNALINGWQATVADKNHDRVKREIQRRCKEKPGFATLLKQHDDVFKDILIGMTLKAFTSILTFGIADGIAAFDAGATEYASGQPQAPPGTTTGLEEAKQDLDNWENMMNFEHSGIMAVDDVFHDGVSIPGNFIADQIANVTGMNIGDKTTATFLEGLIASGHSAAAVGAQTIAVGAGNEMIQVPVQLIEVCYNKKLSEHQLRAMERREKAKVSSQA